LTMFGPI